ncbi:unnamed protein product [Closterium sp. NIES-53]
MTGARNSRPNERNQDGPRARSRPAGATVAAGAENRQGRNDDAPGSRVNHEVPPGFGNPEVGIVAAAVSAPQAPRAHQARASGQERHAPEGQGDRAPASAARVANLSPGRNSRPPSQQNLNEIETARAATRPDFAAILESLDNTAQANLLQILEQLSGAPARRVMERPTSPSAANARATPSRSDRMERRNVSNPAHNVDALHQMTELLATLQRNHANGRPAHPENLRPATRHVEAPEAATDEEEGERGIFGENNEGNGPRPLPHAPTPHSSSALVPIPPARPHLQSALVKSDGVRTQMFGFERIQIIARHA